MDDVSIGIPDYALKDVLESGITLGFSIKEIAEAFGMTERQLTKQTIDQGIILLQESKSLDILFPAVGVCKYCHRSALSLFPELHTDMERNKAAAWNCSCNYAKHARKAVTVFAGGGIEP